jgi:hypothetical protein
MLLISLHFIFLFWVSAEGLYKSDLMLDNHVKGWLIVLASANPRNTLCRFHLTLRYTSISTDARWAIIKLAGSREIFGEIITKPLNITLPHLA